MNLYNDTSINIISFIISIIIFSLLEFFVFYFSIPNIQIKANFSTVNLEETIENSFSQNKIDDSNKENSNWYLEIPIINLKANIIEGTTKETLENAIGHFDESSKWDGNVGLAAHNRGYSNNFFAELKKLNIGDEIKYVYKGKERRYKVIKQQIIQDIDWSVLETTPENEITLITCVENEPTFRRCVKGKQIS